MALPLRVLIACALCGALAGLPPGNADARQLYRYQDDRGIWHFTDRPPPPGIEAQSEVLRVGTSRPRVAVRNTGVQREPVLLAVNEYHGPVELEVVLTRAENVLSDPPMPLRLVLPAISERRVARLWTPDARGGFAYRYVYSYVPGDPNARHDPPGPYRAPFPVGYSFYITQAFHGEFSHQHAQSRYAVDLAMPEGSPVVAARAGVVMEVANDFTDGGPDAEKFVDKANVIRILHDDGSMAVYAHLRLEGAQVVPGSRVRRGQLIAESGNTGFTTGPHLHFAIQVNRGMELVSVPFAFAGSGGAAVVPETGKVLTAFED